MITTPRVGHAFWRSVIIISAVTAASLLLASYSSAATNLVTNGDLEAGATNAPTGWTTDSWGTLSAKFTYPVTGFGGSKAAQVQITSYSSGDAKWTFAHVPVTAGTTYQYSDNYMSGVTTEVDIEYKTSSGSFNYVWVGDAPATGSNWGTFSASIKVPTGVVSMTVLHVLHSVGTLTIDNASVTNGSTPPPPTTPTCALSVNPTSIVVGNSSTLSWSSTNATGGSIDNGVGSVGTSGTSPVSPTATTTYTGTFTNAGLATTTCVTTLSVGPGAPPPPASKPVINSFTATPSTITAGSSTLLSWSTTGASSTSIDQGVGVVNGTSVTVTPSQTTTYTLTATNPAGSVTSLVSVTVNQPPPPPQPKPVINSFSASPSTITSGSSTLLTWSVSGASSTSIDQGVGVVTGTSKSVSPTQTTTYTLTATNPGGSTLAQTTVTVTQPPPPPPPSNNLIANGDLEQGSPNAPTGWNTDYWGTLNATFTYPVTGNGGGKAAQVTVTNYSSGDAKWWFNHIPVSSHTIYQYGEDYNANVATNVTIEFRLSNGNYDYEWLANEPSTGGAWKSFTAQVTVPTNAVSFTILHSLIGNGTLTIDNASLTPVQNQFPEGMVTLVFDDNLVSQYNNARPILNAAGIKATYAIITQAVRDISGDTATMTWAQITTLKNESNEIDAHTRTHPDLTTLSSSQAQTEIQGSYSDLIAQNFSPKTFVYPFGGVNSSIEQLVRNVGFTGARGSYWGLNTPTADRYALYDIRFDRATSAAKINSFIDQAKADKRWLIIELHDVKSLGGDEYTITPTKLQTVVNYIKSTGIKAVTLQDGTALMQSN